MFGNRRFPLLVSFALTVAVAACQAGGDAPAVERESGGSAGVALYDDLGDHHLPITTSSPEAQAYFDQGLRLEYAFNHAEAIRSYEAALEADPDCAMCWWGIALAAGHNINAPLTEDGGRYAYRAAFEAQAHAGDVSAVERALITAVAARYGPDPAAAGPGLDSAYATALADAATAHSDNADVLTLRGAAIMNLSPWNYWDGDFGSRTPRAGTREAQRALEAALSLNPNHPGACHYYIHLVEAAFPERAVECADRLAALMPGAGHIVHMSGHIYIRVGRYADAVTVNEHAVHSDETYISDVGIPSLYTGAYYPHNYHFMAFAATMAGMSAKALEAARLVAPKVSVEIARDVYWLQNAVVLPQLTLLTFGRWQEVLDERLPPAELQQASMLAQYARGTALAALGRVDEAQAILEEITRAAATVEGEPAMNPIPHMSPHVLAGEIALRTGDAAGAVTHFQAAAEIEDALLYDEPPLWYYPVRQSLGRALLEAGRPSEAEAAYRRDLDKFPRNGWSLYGLARSLEAQGRNAEAREVRTDFESAWGQADVELVASRY